MTPERFITKTDADAKAHRAFFCGILIGAALMALIAAAAVLL